MGRFQTLNLAHWIHSRGFDQLVSQINLKGLLEVHSPITNYLMFWTSKRETLLSIASPAYVYDKDTIISQIQKLAPLKDVLAQKFFAIKANSNPDILRLVVSHGFGLECVSIEEVKYVLKQTSITPDKVLFTPNFAPISEYEEALKLGIILTIDNLFLLKKFPQVFQNQKFFVRIDPAMEGQGHSEKVQTSGTRAKFGVHLDDISELSKIATNLSCKIVGLHCHVGSGIFDDTVWAKNAVVLGKVANEFPDVEFINVGGGLGVPYKPTDVELNIEAVAKHLKEVNSKYKLMMEPGRYIVAPCGVLVTRVTQLKEKTKDHIYVGLDAGMNALIRPTLYGSYHEIINLSKFDSKDLMECDVVGPICETGDFLGKARKLPKHTDVDDVVIVCTAGAYGYVMSSDYNQRIRPKEYLI